ncbi:hypothetical protein [Streptomyces sp. NPDC058371]|uniref:hypothetical protein n=1 Tax=Streptomyces sp. NPDC058371 TaxID=3346463 RepID=UPI00364D8604
MARRGLAPGDPGRLNAPSGPGRVGRALLALLYFVLVAPVGGVLRLFRDPLARRPDPAAATYWLPAAPAPPDRAGAGDPGRGP